MVVAVAKAQRCESNCWTGVHRLGRVRLSGGDGGGDRAGVCVSEKCQEKARVPRASVLSRSCPVSSCWNCESAEGHCMLKLLKDRTGWWKERTGISEKTGLPVFH